MSVRWWHTFGGVTTTAIIEGFTAIFGGFNSFIYLCITNGKKSRKTAILLLFCYYFRGTFRKYHKIRYLQMLYIFVGKT